MVANASSNSGLPYFRVQGQVEETLEDPEIPWAIIRLTLVFGEGGLLLNNIARALRRLPVLPVFGREDYLPQPVYAETWRWRPVHGPRVLSPPPG